LFTDSHCACNPSYDNGNCAATFCGAGCSYYETGSQTSICASTITEDSCEYCGYDNDNCTSGPGPGYCVDAYRCVSIDACVYTGECYNPSGTMRLLLRVEAPRLSRPKRTTPERQARAEERRRQALEAWGGSLDEIRCLVREGICLNCFIPECSRTS